MFENVEDQEPERYYDWMLWKMRQTKKEEANMKIEAKRMIWVTFQKEGITIIRYSNEIKV